MQLTPTDPGRPTAGLVYVPTAFGSLSELDDDSRHSGGGSRFIRVIPNSQTTNDNRGNDQTLEALLNSDSVSSLENQHISDILNTGPFRVHRETIDIDAEFNQILHSLHPTNNSSNRGSIITAIPGPSNVTTNNNRNSHSVYDHRENIMMGFELERVINGISTNNNSRAVSYTHLDVYKRQVIYSLYRLINVVVAETRTGCWS